MLKLVLVFAELEREQTAERTRTALKARAERGLWNGGHPPLGYDSVGGGHIVINPVEGDLVRLIFAKYEETRSSVVVYKWLNDNGHRQKVFSSRRRGASGGKPFTIACVQTVLKNRLYLGDIDFKGEIFQGQHEAIVDRDTFERVQAIVANNDKGLRGPPLRTTYDYLLTGVLRCACGHALTTSAGNGKGGRYHYYRCVGLIKKPGQHVCAVKQVRAEHTDDLVMSLVREAARDPKLVAEAVEQVNQMARDLVDPMRTRVEQARAELQNAEDHAARVLTQILSAGIATSPTARRLLADTEARQAQLRAALSQAEGELATRESQFLDLEVTVDALRGFDVAFDHLTPPEKRELLHLLLKQVEVHPDHIVVELYEGRRAIHYLVTNPTLAAVADPAHDPDPGKHDHEPQKHETPGSRPGFVSVPKWLPEVVTTEPGAPNASGFLTTWETRVALPERPSFGRNRFRPCEEARLSATRRRLRVAGHARNEPEASSTACGSAEGDAGHACGPADDDPPVDPWAGALARVRAQLARARQWQAWLDEDPERCAADLARRESLSRARVSQVLKLLTLDATLLADLDRPDRAGPVPSELVLRRIAELPEPAAQRARYRAVCVPSAPTSGGTYRRDDDNAVPAPRHDDFLHDLDRARRYQRWLDEDVHNSLASIGRAEGVSGARVGQLLALLHLDPEIVAVLERPKEALPRGLTHKAVREIARLRGHGAQRAAFGARWPGVLVEVAAK